MLRPAPRVSVPPEPHVIGTVHDSFRKEEAIPTRPSPTTLATQCPLGNIEGSVETCTSSPHLKRKSETDVTTQEASLPTASGEERCSGQKKPKTVAHAQATQSISNRQFESLWQHCFFHAYEPERFATDSWKSCRTPNKAISHVITHTVRRHGLIRGVHQCGQGIVKKYLTVCMNSRTQKTPGLECDKCQRVAEFTKDEMECLAGTHEGPSVCLRCYSGLQTRMDLWHHLHAPVLCADREKLISKADKSFLFYTVFCSADSPPRWTPPSAMGSNLMNPNYVFNHSNSDLNTSALTLVEGTSYDMALETLTGGPGFPNLDSEDPGSGLHDCLETPWKWDEAFNSKDYDTWGGLKSGQFLSLPVGVNDGTHVNNHNDVSCINPKDISPDITLASLMHDASSYKSSQNG